MLEPIKSLMLRLLAVPPEPSLPAGAAETARVFRASRRYLKLKVLRWGFAQASTLIGLVFALAIFDLAAFGAELAVRQLPFRALAPIAVTVFEWIEAFGVLAFVIQLPLTLVPIILDWELRWYIVTDRSLRIREGVWKVSEMTMTFANVQEVSIHQGPLERLFGVADVRVRSAGGGAGGSSNDREREEKSGHIGYFRGVDGAPGIRDLILERLKKQRDAGIGDTDALDQPATLSGRVPASPETLEAARELLAETRALRRTLTPHSGETC